MEKFVDCLIRLPNLRVLEIYSATDPVPITRELERRCAQFPSVRELAVGDLSMAFVGSCPNLESIRILTNSTAGIASLVSYGKGLKRLKRVSGMTSEYIQQGELGFVSLLKFFFPLKALLVVEGFPNLQEIGIRSLNGGMNGPLASPHV